MKSLVLVVNHPSSLVSGIGTLLVLLCLFMFSPSYALNATTDPSEVTALNTIFAKWDVQAVKGLWNLSGEPCSGSAINGTAFEDSANNPAIKCDCSYDNGATCHITQLRVYALNKQGVIPDELADLKYLTFLKLDQNYFTGPLPTFLGNLTSLKTLSVGINALSGTIPKELGNLKQLTLLGLGSNNFSGPLPSELGQLTNLEEIYIDSAGVSGEIPETFANLVKMRTVWASDNAFTGKIPAFIGNWTELVTLRFQGNAFEGPIPSSFSNLTSLTTLRITDIYNGSSTSIDFIKNLKNLTDLSLRNALITGTIPSDIGEYKSLQTLNLGFNNLTGQIPSALFTLSSLTNLFLGNNSLTGNLPSQKSDSLQVIDLSYNYLSGIFPSWVSSALPLNLVVNNFTFDSKNISILPGLNCVQRNFPCNRDAPRCKLLNSVHDADFAIKCGGPQMRSANGLLFEAENSSLTAASFNLTTTEKWGVSNVGLFADSKSPDYIKNTLTQVTSTSSPELFQTSRASPGSLRYYGLGLENGPYSVSLLFAETVYDFPSSKTWQSVGRRVFDIYIQGSRQLKDFDIAKAAGGIDKAITMTFNTTVSENHLEIHLFWGGKGTCCIPEQGDYGPLISALSVVPDFIPTVSGTPSNTEKKSNTALIVGICVSVGAVIMIALLVFLCKRKKVEKDDEEVFMGIEQRPNTFGYSELKNATEDFSPSNKLGEGGFGPVYKGKLSDGRVVAVKQLAVASHQGKNQFVAEIAIISAVQHRNLVKLYGCCIEGSRRLLAWKLHENNRSVELVDPSLTNFNKDEALRVIGISLLCTQASPSMRPSMSRVIAMLTGQMEMPNVISKPSYLTDWSFQDTTFEESQTSFASESTATPRKAPSTKHKDLQTSTVNSSSNLSDIIGEGR
ncbi:hypothetical protein ACFE04_030147 [Oxalis oulophora]